MIVNETPNFIITRNHNGRHLWQGKGAYLNLVREYQGFITEGEAVEAAIPHCQEYDAAKDDIDEDRRLEPDLSGLI